MSPVKVRRGTKRINRVRGISFLVTDHQYRDIQRARRPYETLSDALRRIVFDALRAPNMPEKQNENHIPPLSV